MTTVRPYTPLDMQSCLRLFDSNVPHFFTAAERGDFAAFLERHAVTESYHVVERDGDVVACGGYFVREDGETAGFCWGMVDRSLHRNGIGRLLTEARLQAVRASPGLRRITLDTSQHTKAFYARFGFRVEAVTKDGYGPGLDRYDMVLDI